MVWPHFGYAQSACVVVCDHATCTKFKYNNKGMADSNAIHMSPYHSHRL